MGVRASSSGGGGGGSSSGTNTMTGMRGAVAGRNASGKKGIDISAVSTGETLLRLPMTTNAKKLAWHPSRHILAFGGDKLTPQVAPPLPLASMPQAMHLVSCSSPSCPNPTRKLPLELKGQAVIEFIRLIIHITSHYVTRA